MNVGELLDRLEHVPRSTEVVVIDDLGRMCAVDSIAHNVERKSYDDHVALYLEQDLSADPRPPEA